MTTLGDITNPGDEIWILGAAGRTGRAAAAALTAHGAPVGLVGRDAGALDSLARELPGPAAPRPFPSLAEMAAAVTAARPRVVLNTIGPFSASAPPLTAAALATGGHYLDLANDLACTRALLARDAAARQAGSTLITGAGYGFVATEALVRALCAGRPTPRRVQVAAIPSIALEPGRVGRALAATILESVPAGGAHYRDGRLRRAPVGGAARFLSLPDGGRVTVGSVPTGDLHAAWLASGAPDVTARSSEVPTGRTARLAAPLATGLLSVAPLRQLAVRALARVPLPARPRPRACSWAHATVEWPDGERREGWLRLGDAMAYTAAVAALVAVRLSAGAAPPGAHTPLGALGPELALEAGAELALDPPAPPRTNEAP